MLHLAVAQISGSSGHLSAHFSKQTQEAAVCNIPWKIIRRARALHLKAPNPIRILPAQLSQHTRNTTKYRPQEVGLEHRCILNPSPLNQASMQESLASKHALIHFRPFCRRALGTLFYQPVPNRPSSHGIPHSTKALSSGLEGCLRSAPRSHVREPVLPHGRFPARTNRGGRGAEDTRQVLGRLCLEACGT